VSCSARPVSPGAWRAFPGRGTARARRAPRESANAPPCTGGGGVRAVPARATLARARGGACCGARAQWPACTGLGGSGSPRSSSSLPRATWRFRRRSDLVHAELLDEPLRLGRCAGCALEFTGLGQHQGIAPARRRERLRLPAARATGARLTDAWPPRPGRRRRRGASLGPGARARGRPSPLARPTSARAGSARFHVAHEGGVHRAEPSDSLGDRRGAVNECARRRRQLGGALIVVDRADARGGCADRTGRLSRSPSPWTSWS
jgi:hypothetical protein